MSPRLPDNLLTNLKEYAHRINVYSFQLKNTYPNSDESSKLTANEHAEIEALLSQFEGIKALEDKNKSSAGGLNQWEQLKEFSHAKIDEANRDPILTDILQKYLKPNPRGRVKVTQEDIDQKRWSLKAIILDGDQSFEVVSTGTERSCQGAIDAISNFQGRIRKSSSNESFSCGEKWLHHVIDIRSSVHTIWVTVNALKNFDAALEKGSQYALNNLFVLENVLNTLASAVQGEQAFYPLYQLELLESDIAKKQREVAVDDDKRSHSFTMAPSSNVSQPLELKETETRVVIPAQPEAAKKKISPIVSSLDSALRADRKKEKIKNIIGLVVLGILFTVGSLLTAGILGAISALVITGIVCLSTSGAATIKGVVDKFWEWRKKKEYSAKVSPEFLESTSGSAASSTASAQSSLTSPDSTSSFDELPPQLSSSAIITATSAAMSAAADAKRGGSFSLPDLSNCATTTNNTLPPSPVLSLSTAAMSTTDAKWGEEARSYQQRAQAIELIHISMSTPKPRSQDQLRV